VFGRICRRSALMMCSRPLLCVSGLQTGAEDGRSDVCALPSGVSVPQCSSSPSLIMLPITIRPAILEGLVGGPGLGVLPKLI